MYIELSPQGVIAFCGAVSAVVGLVAGIVVWIVKGTLWVKHQQEQDQEIQDIKEQHALDMNERLEESRLMIGGLLACLKAHQADGHNGPVTENIKSIETYLNNKAHERKE